MPWCPTCKNEYQEGVATCNDCGEDLVSELKEDETIREVFTTQDEELADKFLDYLTYSGIDSANKEMLKNEERAFRITVMGKDYKESQKLYAGFIMTESKNKKNSGENAYERDQDLYIKEDNEHILTDADQKIITELDSVKQMSEMSRLSSTVFVKAEEKYKDHLFSAYTFFIFGLLGIIFVILNMTETITLITVLFSQLVLLALFIIFLILGFHIFRKANYLKSTISDENKLTDEVKNWLTKEVTPEFLSSLLTDEDSEEVSYFTQTEEIKERLMIQFDDLDDILADAIIEEHLNQILPTEEGQLN